MERDVLQSRLDEMFPQGARFVALGREVVAFWVARPAVLADNVLLVAPVGWTHGREFVFEGEPLFESGEVVFRKCYPYSTGEVSDIRLDHRFDPIGLEDQILEFREDSDSWLAAARRNYEAEVAAQEGSDG